MTKILEDLEVWPLTYPILSLDRCPEVVASNISSCLQDMERFGYSERIEKDAQVPTVPTTYHDPRELPVRLAADFETTLIMATF